MITEKQALEIAKRHALGFFPQPEDRLIAAFREVERIAAEECASRLVMRADQIRLVAGEMTAGEMRAVKAVLNDRVDAILAMFKGGQNA